MIKATYIKTNGVEGYRTYLGTWDSLDVQKAVATLESTILSEDPQAVFVYTDSEKPAFRVERPENPKRRPTGEPGVPKESVSAEQTNPKPDHEMPDDFDRTETTADTERPHPAADERQESERKAVHHHTKTTHRRRHR
jgi:hypothetical protein